VPGEMPAENPNVSAEIHCAVPRGYVFKSLQALWFLIISNRITQFDEVIIAVWNIHITD
jgi:hypothetical protein